MPQQLIYTSAPRGLMAGRSGYCTVCRSEWMRDALALRLEQLSYYHHLSDGGQQRPVFAYRIVDIRGSRFHVLSRIQDAGLDFTGRTNFIAHHVVLAPEELPQFPTPPIILRDWPGWIKSWAREPQLPGNEDWASLAALAGTTSVPARAWRQMTGDAINGYGLLEARAGTFFRVDDQTEEAILGLFAESVELLEIVDNRRDNRRDYRAAAWQFTFTTSLQEQDNPADFRWRCLQAGNPATSKFAGPDCRPLSSVRAGGCSEEKAVFARDGRKPPRFVIEPQDARIIEGQPARFQAKAEGVPNPSYEWFAVEAGNGRALAGETNPEMTIQNPPMGVSRYIVRASNGAGEATSRVAILSVEPKPRFPGSPVAGARPSISRAPIHQKSEGEIGGQVRRIEGEKARLLYETRRRRNKFILTTLTGVSVVIVALVGLKRWRPAFAANALNFDWKGVAKKTQKEYPAPPTNTPEIASSLGSVATVSNDGKNSPGIPSASQEKPRLDESDTGRATSSREQKVESMQAPEDLLPPGWAAKAIGAAYYHDAIFDKNETFALWTTARGFATNGDSVFFVYKTIVWKTNQGTILEATIQRTNVTGTAGIMVRESEDPRSRFWFIGASSKKIIASARNRDGHFATSTDNNLAKPISLSFYTQGNMLVARYTFEGEDGERTEQPVSLPNIGGGYAVSNNGRVFVGFALFSGSSTDKVTAHFVTTNL